MELSNNSIRATCTGTSNSRSMKSSSINPGIHVSQSDKTPGDSIVLGNTPEDAPVNPLLSHKPISLPETTDTPNPVVKEELPPEYAPFLAEIPRWKPVKIFLVHGSHTGGHRSAAEALKQALEKMPNVKAEVINALDHSGGETIKNTQVKATDFLINKLGKVRQWSFEQSFKGNPLMYWLGNTAMKIKSWTSKSFLNKINQEKPDLIISTHSPMNSMLSYWKGKGEIDAPVHSVVTDFKAHRMWAQENIDQYYVAGEKAAQDLEKFGIAPEKIDVTGIPIKPIFAEDMTISKAELREKLGLDPNKATVLMMGGSLGFGPFADTAAELDKLGVPLQFVCITGKNEQKKQELDQLKESLEIPMTVLGYTKNVNEWMDASDVVISQPGGLTTSEIFARNLPMIIIEPKEGLAKVLLPSIIDTGAAFSVKDPEGAAEQVKSIITNPEEAGKIQENLARAGKKRASYTIGEQVIRASIKHEETEEKPLQ